MRVVASAGVIGGGPVPTLMVRLHCNALEEAKKGYGARPNPRHLQRWAMLLHEQRLHWAYWAWKGVVGREVPAAIDDGVAEPGLVTFMSALSCATCTETKIKINNYKPKILILHLNYQL